MSSTSFLDSSADAIDVRTIDVRGQSLRVAIKRGSKTRPPLLLFNGIGANWEVAKPFLLALSEVEAIIFDIPGVGGSPSQSLPYRPSTMARLAARLMEQLSYNQIDVAGVSWGGGLAQQFAHQYRHTCRKLVLAATSPGVIMAPGRPSVLWSLATPRRYLDKNFMRDIAPRIYGGEFRRDPQLITRHAQAMSGASGLGYLYQLLALAGWSSLPWLWRLDTPTLILSGSDDLIIPPINGRLMAAIMPNARLEIIDDGHLFMVSRPNEMAARIEKFLAE
jgi:poly(3-hydroxyalkanoate) depolymerase